jgi:hypothetical protein
MENTDMRETLRPMFAVIHPQRQKRKNVDRVTKKFVKIHFELQSMKKKKKKKKKIYW